MASKFVKEITSKLNRGITLRSALNDAGISYNKWRSICDKEGVTVRVDRGKQAKVYTPERVKQVQKRIRNGEFLRDVAADMGMDPRNLARYCRNNGIQLFTKKALQENYKKRNYRNREGIKAHKIEKLINSGYKDVTISNKIGVTRQYVSLIRKRMNMK